MSQRKQQQPHDQRLVVFVSGNGSNLQAILDAIGDGRLRGCQVVAVVSNRKNAYGLKRAELAGIPTRVVSLKAHKDAGKSRVEFDVDLAELAAEYRPDWIVLAGFMHILSAEFLARFPAGSVINLHPALPGQFDGAHAIERAFDAYQSGRIQTTGVMVHRVIPEVDRGAVIVSRPVPIHPTDTLATLEERIHAVEHQLLVEAIQQLVVSQQQLVVSQQQREVSTTEQETQ